MGDNPEKTDKPDILSLIIDVSAKIKFVEMLEKQTRDNRNGLTAVGKTIIEIKQKVDTILAVIGKLSNSIGTINSSKENITKLESALASLANDLKELISEGDGRVIKQIEEFKTTLNNAKEDINKINTVLAVIKAVDAADDGDVSSSSVHNELRVFKSDYTGEMNLMKTKLDSIIQTLADAKSEKFQIKMALYGAVLSIIGSLVTTAILFFTNK